MEDLYYGMSEGGGALIRQTEVGFSLFEIPQYGGEPRFVGTYKTLEEAKAIADKWT